MGSLYKQKNRDGTPGRIWWVKYRASGRLVRESTNTDEPRAAKHFLKEREGRVAIGQPILPRADRIRYDEVAADLRQHYQTTGTRNLVEVEKRLKHLDPVFRGRYLGTLGGAEATAYVVQRQGA